MANYRLVYGEFWTDPKIVEELTPEDKLFFLYLLTNPHTKMCGIYKITIKQMGFDLGYSIETIMSLLERFSNYYGFIKYNQTTKELAIKNWGKYNLNKGGKPVLDCLSKDLDAVTDKSLIKYIYPNIKSETIKKLYLTYINDTSHESSNESSHDTSHESSEGQCNISNEVEKNVKVSDNAESNDTSYESSNESSHDTGAIPIPIPKPLPISIPKPNTKTKESSSSDSLLGIREEIAKALLPYSNYENCNAVYDTWFKNSNISEINGNIKISVSNQILKIFPRKYIGILEKALNKKIELLESE
ncbi:hypothetical protein [Clostridium sp.]|uniref:hypothetical protein n=1 Tax=Clostridium sp. TaxID=1506 RepID=UPI0039941D0F